MPQVADDSTIDEPLLNFFDKELSNGNYCKFQKKIQDRKVILMYRCALSHEKSDVTNQHFTIKCVEVQADLDGNENKVELEKI